MELEITTIDDKPVIVELPVSLEVVVKSVDMKFAGNNTR